MLAGDGNIRRVNAAAGVNVVAEIRAVYRLKRLLSDRRNVRRINPAAAVHITNQHTHGGRNNAAEVSGRVRDITQANCNILGIAHSCEADTVLIRIGPNPTAAY